MDQKTFEAMEAAIRECRARIPDDTDTARAIDRNDAWGEIADHARSEGFHDLAEVCETAENAWWTEEEVRTAASILGRKGGSVKSERKTAAVRENAKKGGRPVEKRTYWILSGEGEEGTWTKHHATPRGIERIATRERAGGDRWAHVWEEIPESATHEAHIVDEAGNVRDIPEEE